MKWKTKVAIPLIVYGSWKLSERWLIDEEVYMGFEQRGRKYGLHVEKHFVTTDDGYMLQMFRVRNEENGQGRPVILQHGFMDSGYGWICNGDKSPLVVLARNGNDVWVGNNRGTSFSRFHKYLNPDHDLKYWDFTFEEMGLYDTKAEIDYIKEQTHKDKVSYIGMSQGSTQMLYALVFNNEYYKKNLNLFIGLGPGSQPSEQTKIGLIHKIGENKKYFQIMNYFNKVEFKASSLLGNRLKGAFGKIGPKYVELYIKEFSELEPHVNDFTSIQRAAAYFPRGHNLKTFELWSQIFINHRLAGFDYGEKENLKRYGSVAPPAIDISKIKDVPIAVMVGKYDKLVPINDSRWIKNNLDSSVLKFYQEYDYGHMTFIVGKEASYLDDVQKLLNEYSS